MKNVRNFYSIFSLHPRRLKHFFCYHRKASERINIKKKCDAAIYTQKNSIFCQTRDRWQNKRQRKKKKDTEKWNNQIYTQNVSHKKMIRKEERKVENEIFIKLNKSSSLHATHSTAGESVRVQSPGIFYAAYIRNQDNPLSRNRIMPHTHMATKKNKTWPKTCILPLFSLSFFFQIFIHKFYVYLSIYLFSSSYFIHSLPS